MRMLPAVSPLDGIALRSELLAIVCGAEFCYFPADRFSNGRQRLQGNLYGKSGTPVTVQGFTVQWFMVSLLVRDLGVQGLPRKLTDTLEPIPVGCIFPSL